MTHLNREALEAAEAAFGKTTGGTMDGRPMDNAITAYLSSSTPSGEVGEVVDRLASLAKDWQFLSDDRGIASVAISEAATLLTTLSAERDDLEAWFDGLTPNEMHESIVKLRDRATTAESQLAKAVEALAPFATYLDTVPFDLDNKGDPLPDDAGPGWTYLTAGDFRKARQTLSDIKAGS